MEVAYGLFAVVVVAAISEIVAVAIAYLRGESTQIGSTSCFPRKRKEYARDGQGVASGAAMQDCEGSRS